MRTLSVFEHGLIAPLAGIEKSLLDQLRGPRNERLFDVGWRETRATSFVGVVRLPQTNLQVLPKMYREETTRERDATTNLLFLLSYTRRLEMTEPEIARLTEQRAPLSEILYWIFTHRLWEAVRREVLRGYVTIEDRLDVLKGRWLVAAQARRPDGWRRDRFDVAFDEFTEDNLPNRLFKATVEKLSRWVKRSSNHEIHEPHESSGGTRSVASAFLTGCHSEQGEESQLSWERVSPAPGLRLAVVLC